MKFEELTKKIVEENLTEYANIRVGESRGGYNGVCISKNANGTFNVVYCDERGEPVAQHLNIPEEEACNMVYETAINEKEYREYKEKKRAEQGMTF